MISCLEADMYLKYYFNLQFTVMIVLSDELLYDKDDLGLVAKHWQVLWLNFLFATKFSVECVQLLTANIVKLSFPHNQLHLIAGFPKVGKEHRIVIDISSSTSNEVTSINFGLVDGETKKSNNSSY